MNTDRRPLISVIIPIYNAGQYLQQCIESVSNQTYRNLEILLVDDGSTDDSPGLCDAYANADQRIQVIHKKNEGLVRARKTGVSRARGEYITYVDADDWIDLDTYETLLHKTAEQDADMILYGLVEEYGDRSVEKENLLPEGYYSEKAVREKIFPQMLCNGIFFRFGILPNLVSKLVRREVLQKIQPMVSDEVELGEDADCTFQMLLQCREIQIVRFTPYHYRKRPDSMVWSRTSFFRCKNLYRDLKQAFEKSGERAVLMPQLYQYMLFILLLKSAERFIGCGAFDSHFNGKRIVLYGAGGFGQEIYRTLTQRMPGEIVLWADQRAQAYRSLGLPVSGPEKIADCKYDGIFIAVLDTQICGKIAVNLREMGVAEEKISYIDPDERYVEMLIQILEAGETDKNEKG